MNKCYNSIGNSLQELMCRFTQKINENVNLVNSQEERIKYLLDQGVELEVAKKIDEFYRNGELEKLINQGLLKDINTKVDNVVNEVNTKIPAFDTKFTTEISRVDNKIKQVAEKGTTVEVIEKATKSEIEKAIQDGRIANLTIQPNSITGDKIKENTIEIKSIKNNDILTYDIVKNCINITYENPNYKVTFLRSAYLYAKNPQMKSVKEKLVNSNMSYTFPSSHILVWDFSDNEIKVLTDPSTLKYGVQKILCDFRKDTDIKGIFIDLVNDYNTILNTYAKGVVTDLNSVGGQYEIEIKQNVYFSWVYSDSFKKGTKTINKGTKIKIPENSYYVYDTFSNEFKTLASKSDFKKYHIILMSVNTYASDSNKQFTGLLSTLKEKPISTIKETYTKGFIKDIFTDNKKQTFKVEVVEDLYITWLLNDTTYDTHVIRKGQKYEIQPQKAMVLNTSDKSVSIIGRSELKPNYILLLATPEYATGYQRNFKGLLTDRQIGYDPILHDNVEVRTSYIDEIDKKINSCIGLDSDFTFMFGSDYHIDTPLTPVLNVQNKIYNELRIDSTINGGDTVALGRKDPLKAYNSLKNLVKNSPGKTLIAVGNHDYNHVSGIEEGGQEKKWIIPYKDVYRILSKNIENDVVWGSRDRMYYYKDYEKAKIRVIILNTLDRPEQWIERDGTQFEKYTWLMNTMSTTQMNWFIDTALNFRNKRDKKEWNVIVVSHSSAGKNVEWNNAPLLVGTQCRQIIEAFKEGSFRDLAFTDTTFGGWSSINRRVDFQSQGAMNVICWLSGHNHIDTHQNTNGINYLTIVSGYPDTLVPTSQSMKGEEMVRGDITEFGLDVCYLDKSQRKLTLKRFGVGKDREITY